MENLQLDIYRAPVHGSLRFKASHVSVFFLMILHLLFLIKNPTYKNCKMKDMVAAGNLSSESQHDGDDVGGGGGVDDMRSDPYRPRSLASSQTKIDARVRHVQFKERAACLSLLHRRTNARTDGRRDGLLAEFRNGLPFPFSLGGGAGRPRRRARIIRPAFKSAPNDFLSGKKGLLKNRTQQFLQS